MLLTNADILAGVKIWLRISRLSMEPVSAAQEVFDTAELRYSGALTVPDAPKPLRVAAACAGSVLQRFGDLFAGTQNGACKPLSVSKDVEQGRPEIRVMETAP